MRGWSIVFALAVAAVFALGVTVPAVQADESAAAAEEAEQAPVYSCPMHPEMKATFECRCPKCGMMMKKAEQAPVFACPMHREMRATFESRCPMCGRMMAKMEKPSGMPMPMMGKKKTAEGESMGGMMAKKKAPEGEAMGGMMAKKKAPEGESMAGMMAKMGNMKAMMSSMKGTMADMRAMMMRCRMMMNAEIHKTDPAGILALKKDLDLSDVQVRAITRIAARARREAEAILTDEQSKKLDEMGGRPESMAEMHSRMKPMMEKMMQKMKEGAETGE